MLAGVNVLDCLVNKKKMNTTKKNELIFVPLLLIKLGNIGVAFLYLSCTF